MNRPIAAGPPWRNRIGTKGRIIGRSPLINPLPGVTAMNECTNCVFDGKRYEGFAMYTAMEGISISVSKLRLMIEDLLLSTDQYAVSYGKVLRGGVLPGQLSYLGRDVYMRSSIMLDYVCQIEEALKRFDIQPE
jgi:hypothetical protein